jgi:hypothetical protein
MSETAEQIYYQQPPERGRELTNEDKFYMGYSAMPGKGPVASSGPWTMPDPATWGYNEPEPENVPLTVQKVRKAPEGALPIRDPFALFGQIIQSMKFLRDMKEKQNKEEVDENGNDDKPNGRPPGGKNKTNERSPKRETKGGSESTNKQNHNRTAENQKRGGGTSGKVT